MTAFVVQGGQEATRVCLTAWESTSKVTVETLILRCKLVAKAGGACCPFETYAQRPHVQVHTLTCSVHDPTQLLAQVLGCGSMSVDQGVADCGVRITNSQCVSALVVYQPTQALASCSHVNALINQRLDSSTLAPSKRKAAGLAG